MAQPDLEVLVDPLLVGGFGHFVVEIEDIHAVSVEDVVLDGESQVVEAPVAEGEGDEGPFSVM